MDIFRIKTTAWQEEDFVLLTTLNEDQIREVITPIVELEREGDGEYDNGSLVLALQEAYPNDTVEEYSQELYAITI